MSTPAKAAAKPATVHRARIPADAMAVLVVQTLVLAGVWAMAIWVSFTGLVAAAGWANVAGVPRFGVPLFIDGILVGASLAYLVARERRDRASQAIAVLAMTVFCGLSIAGNATHAAGSSAVGAQRVTGIALAVAAPIAILVTTELLARTVVANPADHVPAVSRRAARRVAQQAAQAAPIAALEPAAPAAQQPVQSRAPRQNTNKPGRNGSQRKRTYTDEERARWVQLKAEGRSQREIEELTGASKSAIQAHLAAVGVGAAA